jgi:glucokinase
MAKEAIDLGEVTELSKPENLEARDIIMAARAGDKVADQIIKTAAYYLGLGLGNVINLCNPDTIVIGGGVSHAGDILFGPLEAYTRASSLESAAEAVKIVPAELGNDAGCIGAAALVLQETGVKIQ